MKKNDIELNPSNKNYYRRELDGLRALAVISVIINHFEKSLMVNGYLGVDIFFVLSGYVITGSLMNREVGSLGNFITQFYVRRIKRLVPSLILVCLVTGICTLALVYKSGFSITTGFFSLVGFSNHFLLNASLDYFSPSAQLNTFTHTWSLGVEEQFYLFFPILFWLTARIRKTPENKLLFYLISTFSFLSFILFIYLNNHNQPMAYFLMPSRFWELGVGCLVYLITNHIENSNRNLNIPTLPIIILLVSSLFISLESTIFSTINVIFFTSLLIVFLKPRHITYRIFTQKYIVYIGLISYSLYLWHWPILSLSRWTVGINFFTAVWQIPLMFILAILTYEYLEKTLRRSQWSLKNRNIIFMGFGASALSIMILAGAYFFRTAILLRSFPWENLTPVVKNLECHLPTCDDPISHCLSNNNKDKNVIYIIGDSHAANLVPSIEKSIENKLVVKYLTDRALVLSIFGSSDCGGTKCSDNEYKSRLEFFANNLKKGDIVLFSMARDRIYDGSIDYPKERINSIVKERLRLLELKLRNLGELINKKKSTLILVDDIPKLCDNYDIEVNRNAVNPCPIDKSVSIRDRQPLTNVYLSLKNVGVKYIDPHPILCPDNTCFALYDGILLYTDSSPHFAEFNSTPLTNLFKVTFNDLQ